MLRAEGKASPFVGEIIEPKHLRRLQDGLGCHALHAASIKDVRIALETDARHGERTSIKVGKRNDLLLPKLVFFVDPKTHGRRIQLHRLEIAVIRSKGKRQPEIFLEKMLVALDVVHFRVMKRYPWVIGFKALKKAPAQKTYDSQG